MELCNPQASRAYTFSFGMENRNDDRRDTTRHSPQDTSVQRRMSIASLSSTPRTSSSIYLPPSPAQGSLAQRDPAPPRLPPLSRTVSASQPHHPEERSGTPRSRHEGILSPDADGPRVPISSYPARLAATDSSRTPGSSIGLNLDGAPGPGHYPGRHSPQNFSPPKSYQSSLLASRYPNETSAKGAHPERGTLGRCSDCADVTSITQQVISSLLALDLEVQSTITEKHSPSPSAPDVVRDGPKNALNWALDTIQETTKVLRQRRGPKASSSPYSNEFKRKDELAYDDHTAKRSRTGSVSGSSSRQYATQAQVEPHSNPSRNMQMSQPRPSPQGQVPLGAWTAPGTSNEDKMHAAYLEDLQQQVSVRTMKLTTLQREHDSLLQKLERQRTKCATLERKFETSDMEINSLSDERDRLQSQVTVLESQVENLQKDRDEARSQSVANNGQYLKIVELSSRLQKQAAEDKKRWNEERAELLSTLRQAREHTLMRDQPNEKPKREHGEIGALMSGGGAGRQKVTENVSDGEYDPPWLEEEEECDPCHLSIEELCARNKLLRLALIDVNKEIQAIQQATQRIYARNDTLRSDMLGVGSKPQQESAAKPDES